MKRWLAVLVLVLLAACSGGSSAAPATTTRDPNLPPQSAIDSCHSAVESELTSPGTVRYDPAGPPEQSAAGPSWEIRGTIDSQNGFGALVRSNYVCAVEPGSLTGTNQEWVTRVDVTPK